jgi:ribosome modulation factor
MASLATGAFSKGDMMARGKKLEANPGDVERKGRPRKPKVKDTLRKYTEAEQAEARQRLCDAHDQQLSTHGLLRSQAKTVTKAIAEVATMTGTSKKSVRWGLENRKRPPSEIDAETRERTRVAKYFGMPIGTQLGIDFDGRSVADKVETDGASDEFVSSIERASQEGHAAGAAGRDQEHTYEGGSPEELAYAAGWRAGQEEITDKFRSATHEPAHA